jgi:hypothetical protein
LFKERKMWNSMAVNRHVETEGEYKETQINEDALHV